MGKVGKVKVKLDKPYYTAGGVVSGVVYLKNNAPIELDKVYIKANGKEKVVWEEHWDEQLYEGTGENRRPAGKKHHEREYDEKQSFFKKKIKITGQDAILMPGKWAFPFQFQLPTQGKKGGKLTGTFKIKDKHAWGWRGAHGEVRNLKVKVEYSLKACIDLEDSKDLEKKIDFTVYEQLPEAIVTPSGEKTAKVLFLCCIPKGDLTIKATLGKNFYCPGEQGVAIAEIRNGSTMEVQAAVELNRTVRLKADGHRIQDHDMKKLGRFEKIPPETTKTVEMRFQVPNELPSTNGRYVDCQYVMDVLAEISMAPDIEIHFPVNIFVPEIPPDSYTSDFADDLATYQVMAACSVADMALKPGYA